jgi:hypothetical protein
MTSEGEIVRPFPGIDLASPPGPEIIPTASSLQPYRLEKLPNSQPTNTGQTGARSVIVPAWWD